MLQPWWQTDDASVVAQFPEKRHKFVTYSVPEASNTGMLRAGEIRPEANQMAHFCVLLFVTLRVFAKGYTYR
jgi:hypothetical protein